MGGQVCVVTTAGMTWTAHRLGFHPPRGHLVQTSSTPQSFNSAASTLVTFDTESHAGVIDAAASAVVQGGTPWSKLHLNLGWWFVSAFFAWTANTTGSRFIGIRKNGATYIFRDRKVTIASITPTGQCAHAIGGVYHFATSDYVELVARQDSGSPLTAYPSTASYRSPRLSAVYLGGIT